MDETVYDAAWRAYKAAPRAVANGPSRSAVRAAVDAALAASQPVLILPEDARLTRVIADNIERGKLDHPGFYRNSQLAEVLRRVLSAALAAQAAQGWVVADGQGTRWRKWGDFGPEWTVDRDAALHFARRTDAEAFAKEDEDAWLIQPVGAAAQEVEVSDG